MASNSQLLSLIIQATDKASGVIAGISTKLAGLGNAAGAAAVKSGNLSDSIASGMIKAQLAVSGLTLGYQKLANAIQEASRIELENLSASSGLADMVGGFEVAEQSINRVNVSLAKAAAALPGSTAGYTQLARNISDDVAAAFKGSDGKIANLPAFEDRVQSIATSYAAMAATTGVATGNMQLFLVKALGGTSSMAELGLIDALQKNAQLRNKLNDGMKALGIDSLKDLSVEKRIEFLDKIGKSVITPEFLKRSQNTVEGMWQSFVSNLFDPMGGIFGVMRDLEPQIEGQQTAFESIKKTIALVIGTDGLFEQIGGIMAALGLSVDPMRVLRDGADRLNSFLQGIKTFLQGIRTGIGEGYGDFGELLRSRMRLLRADIFGFFGRIFAFDPKSFTEIGVTLGQNLAATINRGMQWLGTIDWSKAFSQVGQWVGGAINVAVKSLTGFLAGIDWSKANNLSSGFTQGLIQGILSFLRAIDYGAIAQLAIQVIGSLLIGSMISFGSIVGTGLTTLATTGGPMLLNGIGAGLETLKNFVVGAIGESAGMFGSMISGLWSQLGNAVGQGVQALGAKIMDLFSAIAAKIGEAILMVRNNPVSQTIGTVASAVTNPIGTAANMIDSVMPKFAGHIPNAANGLVAAANAEAKAMPSGARLVMANDSETIIPRGKALSGGRGGNTFNFNITGDNPDAIANKVMTKIQQAFEAELNAQLA
jgi:hypothetical protein